MSYETWKTTSPAYRAYLEASRRCADAFTNGDTMIDIEDLERRAAEQIAAIDTACREAFKHGRHDAFAAVADHARALAELLPEDDQDGAAEVDAHLAADHTTPKAISAIFRKIIDRLEQYRAAGTITEECYREHYNEPLKELKLALGYWWDATRR